MLFTILNNTKKLGKLRKEYLDLTAIKAQYVCSQMPLLFSPSWRSYQVLRFLRQF